MTLNGEMALILRYFTEFGNDPYFVSFHRIRVRCRRKKIVRLASVSKLLAIVYDHINTICAIIQRLFRQQKQTLITRFDGCRCIDD